jgi:hypothetical protein
MERALFPPWAVLAGTLGAMSIALIGNVPSLAWALQLRKWGQGGMPTRTPRKDFAVRHRLVAIYR